jgi:hypothetical protein
VIAELPVCAHAHFDVQMQAVVEMENMSWKLHAWFAGAVMALFSLFAISAFSVCMFEINKGRDLYITKIKMACLALKRKATHCFREIS